MEIAARRMFSEDFAGRVLSFERDAAWHYADIMSVRRRAGRRIEPVDTMIAATARANGASLATRNIAHFQECGIVLHDPWQSD